MKLAVLAALLLVVVPLQAQAESCTGKHLSLLVAYGKGFTGLEDPRLYVEVSSCRFSMQDLFFSPTSTVLL